MKNKHILIAAAAMTMGIGMPAQADPPPWAPAHGRRAKEMREEMREYRYVYYPAQRVYYAPDQQVWFWMSGANWQFGVNLPMQYRTYATGGVPVVLHSSRPYVEHVYVEEHYGRPWREKHKYKHKDEDKHWDKHEKHWDKHEKHWDKHHGRDHD
jgi:hypothetical protein